MIVKSHDTLSVSPVWVAAAGAGVGSTRLSFQDMKAIGIATRLDEYMLGGILHDVALLLRYDVLNGTTSAHRERRFLCEAEAFASFVDRQQELLSKHLIRRVLRKIDLVEACEHM